MADVDSIVVPGHALPAPHPPGTIFEEQFGSFFEGELAGIWTEGALTQLPFDFDAEVVCLTATCELAALAGPAGIKEVNSPAGTGLSFACPPGSFA